ncbi:MAG: hypothetical protein IKZ02_00620 [Alphaproteobacteria bacterium]|nr:hypothetical protein [Alphaproteobacteria bacterium]
MKKVFLTLIFALIVGLTSSCATIVRESTQNVPIKSNIDKVDIRIINKSGKIVFEGQTPTVLTLNAAEKSGYFNPAKYTVIASKNGFKTQQTIIDWHVSGWYLIGNLVFGGIIGYLLVDPISGDMYYLDKEVNLNMSPN